ncbi:probable polygalacturonase At1g80170 isoform X2 [Prosopis cineraria]|uniref:probable polygalacturonase At1g80170 isoform X2 n=1 Tax=Prosopis cineraria TaxID=364024 RepID=UPI002410B487|nr:probable polygalacturonase At1g80170 isoform X2 [Prosopis cineraria]
MLLYSFHAPGRSPPASLINGSFLWLSMGEKGMAIIMTPRHHDIIKPFLNIFQALEEVWKTACAMSGRITILFPPEKEFLIYPIDLGGHCRSKITLKILGTIVAPKDPEVWDGLNPRKWLYFHGLKYLTLDGGGKINGMGQKWWDRSCKTNSSNPCRPAPTAITFHRCKNLKVRDLMILNSQKMHMAFSSCMRVVASKLVVLAPASSPNTDGIHISRTKGIEVKESSIRTGDDCISIVSNSSRVKISNISCGPGHGISIGSLGKSGTWEKVQDVMVSESYLYQTDNGVRIKTWQGGDGFASQITFKNIVMANVSNPIIIDQFYCDSPYPCQNQTSAVKVENISFIGIKGTSATEEAIKFACSDYSPCERLYLEDIFLTLGFGGNIRSSCWKAHGSTNGWIYPPHCFPETNDSFDAPKTWEELESLLLPS